MQFIPIQFCLALEAADWLGLMPPSYGDDGPTPGFNLSIRRFVPLFLFFSVNLGAHYAVTRSHVDTKYHVYDASV